jgi:hypothetical protein
VRLQTLYQVARGVRLLAAVSVLPTGGLAQDAPPVPAATPASAGQVAALAEEIAVLRTVQPLRATPEQLASLAKIVSDAQERLTAQAQTDTRAIAALRDPVLRARQQLLQSGTNPNDPQLAAALQTDQQVNRARQTAQRNEERLRDELAQSLRRQLQTLLSPDQLTALLGQGRAMVLAERATEDRQREQMRQQFQQSMAQRGAATPPANARGGRGGPGGRESPQRMMEQLRGADTQQFERMSRGMARRFGDEGTPAYQNALSAFQRIRSMPDAQFRRQRADLVQQFGAAMTAPRSPATAALTISAENATDTWVRRYLLSPQAPAALQSLMGKSGG